MGCVMCDDDPEFALTPDGLPEHRRLVCEDCFLSVLRDMFRSFGVAVRASRVASR